VRSGQERGRGSYLESCKSWAGVVQRPLLDSYRPETVGLHGEEVYPVTGYHHPRTAERAKRANFVDKSICTLTPHSHRVGPRGSWHRPDGSAPPCAGPESSKAAWLALNCRRTWLSRERWPRGCLTSICQWSAFCTSSRYCPLHMIYTGVDP